MSIIALKKSDEDLKNESQQSEVAKALSQTLANTFVLYLKTQNYHWNVEGSKFVAIHKLTEEHYQNLFLAIDELAERIRALGFYAPGTMKDFAEISTIKDAKSMPIADTKMIADLVDDHVSIVSSLKKAIKTSDKDDDTTTTDILSGRRKFHEEAAWMLKSMVK